MKNSWQKVLSFALALVMVLGMIPVTAIADEVQQTNASALSDSMDGLSIAYPYNTETVQQSGTPVSRFEALTFESARNEVESAQMILSPDFDITSFELTMGSLKNEKGNIIPSWAFEVYIQHYVTVSGSGNAPYWSDTFQMYNPTYSKTGNDGTYPDALLPQDAAISAGENKISAGKNGGIWVNLNVQNAAPGTYTGTATLNVNGTDMNIPVSVHIYDVSLPDQVHTKSSVGIWWDMVENGEGYIDRNLADTYFDYLVSKRIMPFDAWSLTRWDEAFADYAANYLAVSPEISSYSLFYAKNAQGSLDIDILRTTLTTLINKNISMAQSGSNVDLFAKAYLYFGSICDEPRDDAEYRAINNITAQLDNLKAELAPMLDAYPSLKASFMNLKHLVTGPNPTDKTYADKVTGSLWNKETFIDDDYGSTSLTGDSYIYAPQYQWLNTESQRALYAEEEELWWYGCCHPISPYPAYHINTPLVSARVESWMRYDYGIDGFVYSSVNIWGEYTDNGIKSFDYWNGYVNNGTPGDQILVLPGSDYGVYGPIGTIRIENIREGNEDYEYLWMLENEYGISDISAYTANLYSGVIADTDASIHYNNRKALLTKLEELSVAKNGATVIAPGNEGFVRGQEIKPSTNLTIELGNTEEVATLSFDYKVTSGTFNISLNPDWDNAFGYFAFDANGKVDAYEGVSVKKLDDGYYHVTFQLSKLTKYNGNPSKNLSFLYVRGAWTDATGYIDNVQYVLAKDYVEVYRGREITPSTSLTLELGNTEELSSLSFDYKVLSGTFNISLNPDWDNAFGYFAFDANGNVDPYDGVTLETLDDDYIRVTFDLAALTKYSGNPGKALSFLYIRGSWTDAAGYIDNIKYVVAEKPVEPENRGQEIISRTDLTIELGNSEELSTLSFDYKLTSGTFNISLNPDWDNYYGYFAFDANGNVDPYDGVTLQTLEDGYTRVTFDLAALTKYSGSPSKVLTFLYLRGAWSDATGYIDNVQLNAGEEPEQPTEPEIVTRGQEIAPSTDLTIELGNTEEIATLSFDYKVTSGTFNISLNPDWDNSFGYFAFDANGNVDPYDGVTVETLDDGYFRVTYDMAALTKYSGNPSKALSFLYIRGNWTDATGHIDNVTFTVQKENEPGSGRVLIAADVHVSADDAATHEHLKKTLTYAKNNGVDLLIFNGDTVNVGNEADYAALDSIFTEVFGSPEQANVKFIFNMGNHEFYPTGACAHQETDYALQFNRFAAFASKWSDFTADQGSIYLTEVNGISYVVAAPSDDWTYMEDGKLVYCAALGGYHDNDIALIDSLIAQATANNPGEPVYLLSHHPWGETYGGASYGMPETKVVTAMKAVMEKYPHLVNVTSHTHFSSVHERSFVQDKWTTINTGMHTYGKYVDIETDVNGEALNYINIDGRRYTSTDPEGKALHGATHFVWDVSYGEDSFTAKVFNMATETAYSYLSYTVPYGITAENKGEKFAYELTDRTAPTLTWSAEDVLTVELVKNGSAHSLQIAFNDTDQFYATEGYRIKVVNAATGETLKTVLWASRFWAAQEKKDSYEITVDGVTQCSEYKVTVEAIDFYGNYSAAKLEATVQSSGTVETETGLLLQKCNGTNADCSARDYSRIYFGTTPFTSSSDTLTLVAKTDCTSIKLRAVSNVSDDWEGSAVSKDLEDLGDGWKTATWTLSELIGSNDITTMNGFRIDSLVDGMDILMKDILINNQTDWVGEFQSNYHGVVTQQQIEVKTEEEVFRGQQIVSRTDLTIEFGNAEELATLSFDYKLISGTFNISLNPDWDNAFGYFAFDANGNVDPYDGVSLETLEDGYTRVTFDLAALTKYSGNPSKVLTFLYLRGAWSDATGYIDNIQYTVKLEEPTDPPATEPPVTEPPVLVFDGGEFIDDQGLNIGLNNSQAVTKMSFDYKVTSGTDFVLAFRPDWGENYYGNFVFNTTGSTDPYSGITTEALADGYVRVFVDVAALNTIQGSSPSNVLTLITVHNSWGDASGVIENIRINEAAAEPSRGQKITPSTSLTIELGNTEELETVSFDYKVTSGTFNISLNPDWDNAFGYFAFDANGNVDPYDGVTLETLEDGYTRVTFDLAALTKYNGNPGKALSFLYIRGAWTDATGYIDNIQYTVAEKPVEPENRGQEFSANTDLTIDLATTGVLGTLSFDYKITGGEAFNISLNPNWGNYFGYFAYTAEGCVDPYNGVTTEVLDDGYVRVTFDMDALTKVSGTPSKFIDFIYIRGGWTTANGYIDNIQWTEGCEHNYETVVKEPTFTEVGGNVHTCSKCGNSYVTEEIPAYTFQVKQWNVALADDIRANFHLNVDSRLSDAKIIVMGKTYDLSALNKTEKGDYELSVNVAAAQMTDDISIQIVYGEVASEELTYSIRQYAEKILTGTYSNTTKELVKAMLHYGAMAQTYFGYNTGNLANKDYVNTEAVEIPAVDTSNMVSGSADGIRFYGASLVFESKVAVRFYFVVDGDINSYTFSTGTPVAKNDMYYIEVPGINPQDYATDIVLTVNDTLTVTYSPLTYISRKAGADNALANLVKAMYAYHLAAKAYLNGVETLGVSYSFTGNEADRAGYAEGTVAIANAEAGQTYEFYWADKNGKLSGYRALGSVSLTAEQTTANLTVAENTMIPAGADRLIICITGSDEAAGTYLLGEKANTAELETKFAVISDVHTNYNQGENYLLDALEQFESEGVSYIIVTGDIGESDSDYAKYVSAVEKSNFSGLIFASIGNHDQTETGRKNFKTYAIYDGSTKTWVGIDNAPAYFTGNSNVAVELAGENLAYYVVTIGENAFIFMDQELTSTGNTPNQDNFSKEQLNFVEDKLYQYSATHNLFIIEHAPVEQLKIGDKFDPGYGGAIQLSAAYPNNQRFVDLLMEYTEAIWLSGHTHVQYDTGIMYVDKYYDASENLTDSAIAHAVHVSSLAQPRWYEGSSMKMPNDFSAASQGYVCYQYADDIVFEARSFKNYTPDSITYNANLFINEVNAVYSWAIPLETLTHDAPSYDEEEGGDDEVTLVDYAVAENGNKRAGSPTWEDTADGLKVTFAAASDRFEIKTGDQTEAFTNGYMVQFKIKTDLTSFDLGGSNYSGSRKTYIQVNLAASGDQYTVTDLSDGWKLVTIPMTNLGHDSIITEFAIRFYNTNAAGTFYLKELYLAPEMAQEVATDYAIAENGNKRAGSPTWEDTADGLKVTFAAASDRFEIKTGDQTEAFTNGYTVQFKIKTDLTSFDLGGSNYSGSRKTYIQVNLAASGEQYTVTDLGDGWKLVTIPMTNLGHSSIITEFAIRFYNTNAAGAFYLKDLNIIPVK